MAPAKRLSSRHIEAAAPEPTYSTAAPKACTQRPEDEDFRSWHKPDFAARIQMKLGTTSSSFGTHNPAWKGVGLEPPAVDFKPVTILDGIGTKVAVELEEGILSMFRNKVLIWNCNAPPKVSALLPPS